MVSVKHGCTQTYHSESELKGYCMYRGDRTHRRGGGCLLYIKETIKTKEVVIEGQNRTEVVWAAIMNGKKEEVVLGVVYRRPGISEEEDNDLHQTIGLAAKQHRNLVIMGDFNYPNIQWGSRRTDKAGAKFLELIDDCYLHQHVTEPTRYGNILDLVFSSEADMIEDVDVREPAVNSDHCTIHFKLVVRRQAKNKTRQTRDYNRGDWESIRRDLHAIAWKPLLEDKTCEEQLKIFTVLIEQQVDRKIPWKRQRGKHEPRWMNKRMQKCIRKKRKKWKKFKDSGRQEDYLAFKVIQSQTTLAVKETKRDFEKKLAKNIKKDSKSFYAYYREKNISRVGIGPLEDADGQTVTDELEQATILNSFFSSVFTKEETTDYELPLTRFSEEDNERLTDIDITRDKVLQKLQKLDPAKASGVDGISSRVLVELADEIAEPLAAIFQNSLATGEVPRSWKVADIVPIYKKGKKSVPGNYRPVSLTSQIGKLLEKIIKDEITGHLSQYHLLNDTQHGFMRGRSCLTNLLTYMEGVTRMLDEGKNVDIIYLDFAKAFDKVPHHRLIGKVASMGVEGRVKGWIQQWLEGRTQRVVINGRYSDWTAVTSGVPQGSVLGPTLFLMFINDLEDSVQSTVLKFADDTKLYTEVTKEEGGEQLQEDLDKCTEWDKQWMMEFNVSKCKVLHA